MTHPVGATPWQPIDTAPQGVIVDVLFDPEDCDADFYCPSGKATGLWRMCHVYFDGQNWWHSDGLDALQKHPIRERLLTHWMHLPAKPTAEPTP